MRKNFIKFLLVAIGMVSMLSFVDSVVLAQSEYNMQLDAFASSSNFGERKDPRAILSTLIATFMTVLGTVFLAYSVYGGAIIMTSAGNSEKVEEGKATLRRGVIGVVVILSAYSIVVLVERLAPSVRNQREPLVEVCTGDDAFCASVDAGIQPLPENEQDTTPVCWGIFCR